MTPQGQEVPSEPTRSFLELTFDCFSNNENLGSFSYVDYTGGNLNNDIKDPVERKIFQDKIKNASVFFVLLDGIKIIQLLRERENTRTVTQWIEQEINNQISFIYNEKQDDTNTQPPIYLIITKWDCIVAAAKQEQFIKDADTSLLQHIKKRLGERSLRLKAIMQGNQSRKIRLIPVGSLGRNFGSAEFNSDGTYKIVRINNDNITPYLVDIPLQYALFDRFDSIGRDFENAQATRDWWIKAWKNTLYVLQFSVDPIFYSLSLISPGYTLLPKQVIKGLFKAFRLVTDPTIKLWDDYVGTKKERERIIAIQTLVKIFAQNISKFERDFPGCFFD